MAQLNAVFFNEDQDVEHVSFSVDRDEYAFIYGENLPCILEHPVRVHLSRIETAEVFHRAEKALSGAPESAVAEGIFRELALVVDRLIEWESP